jgi:low affinity Fe/Cu permease
MLRCRYAWHSPARHPDPDPDRVIADVALQWQLGILPQWRVWPGGSHRDCSALDGSNITMLGCSSPQRVSTAVRPARTVFDRFARWTEHQLGRSVTFALAVLSIAVWGVTGPLFGWSDTWQLVINTGTTIVTFLMVFVIQNAQNRDTQALQLKLDELIRVNMAARNSLMGLEEKSEAEVEDIKSALVDLAASTEETPVESIS